MLVLTEGHPDALDSEGVRAEDVVFVVRRGWLNDMLNGGELSSSNVGKYLNTGI